MPSNTSRLLYFMWPDVRWATKALQRHESDSGAGASATAVWGAPFSEGFDSVGTAGGLFAASPVATAEETSMHRDNDRVRDARGLKVAEGGCGRVELASASPNLGNNYILGQACLDHFNYLSVTQGGGMIGGLTRGITLGCRWDCCG